MGYSANSSLTVTISPLLHYGWLYCPIFVMYSHFFQVNQIIQGLCTIMEH